MDSVTQAVLGAAVGQSLMGKQIGRAAPITGAILGTLPDLDVLISFGGAVENFTYHRSFSHSLIVLTFITPLIVWGALKLQPLTQSLKTRWTLTILAIFWTHVLLDALTVYGTQLFWPLSNYPIGLSSIFIVDPLYTVPLIIGLFIAGKKNWSTQAAHKAIVVALSVSTLYLVWTVSAKAWLHETLDVAVAKQGLSNEKVLSTPMPLQSLLWRIIVTEDNHYYVAHAKPWDDPSKIEFRRYDKGENLLESNETTWDIERLQWFTKGFYRASIREDQVVMSDLRMGVEGSYVFNFAIASLTEAGKVITQKATRVEDEMQTRRLKLVWQRLWDSSVSLHPE